MCVRHGRAQQLHLRRGLADLVVDLPDLLVHTRVGGLERRGLRCGKHCGAELLLHRRRADACSKLAAGTKHTTGLPLRALGRERSVELLHAQQRRLLLFQDGVPPSRPSVHVARLGGRLDDARNESVQLGDGGLVRSLQLGRSRFLLAQYLIPPGRPCGHVRGLGGRLDHLWHQLVQLGDGGLIRSLQLSRSGHLGIDHALVVAAHAGRHRRVSAVQNLASSVLATGHATQAAAVTCCLSLRQGFSLLQGLARQHRQVAGLRLGYLAAAFNLSPLSLRPPLLDRLLKGAERGVQLLAKVLEFTDHRRHVGGCSLEPCTAAATERGLQVFELGGCCGQALERRGQTLDGSNAGLDVLLARGRDVQLKGRTGHARTSFRGLSPPAYG